jgi:hypothetical protein
MILTPECYHRGCKWYKGIDQPDGTEKTEVNVCEAFPEGIPEDIAYGANKHLKVIEGQTGDFTFEEVEDNGDR